MGTSMLVLTGTRLVGNLCSWQCANIPCFKPPPSWQTRLVSSIVSLPLSIVLHILTRFERRRTCSCCYMCAPFLPFSSHKFLHLFTFAHPFFPASFCSFFPFFIVLFLYPIFTRTFLIALNIFFLYASIDATIRLSLSVFIRLNPRAISGFLQWLNMKPPGRLSTTAWEIHYKKICSVDYWTSCLLTP